MISATNFALTELGRQRGEELDAAIAVWRRGAGAGVHLWCAPGCGNCCALTVNCTLAEALAIHAALAEPWRERLAAVTAKLLVHARQCADARAFLAGYRQAVGPCPFLDDDAHCAVYDRRPLACRALLATRPADWCGINLAELSACERDLFLNSLDRDVVAFPTHYATVPQTLASDYERGLIVAMIRHLGFGVTGNLPLLVWLAGQDGCDQAMAGGEAAFAAFLAKHHCARSFLVQTHRP